MITQVHDELVFAGLEPKEEKIVEEAMCDFRPYKLKVSHGSGRNWWKAFCMSEGIADE